MLTTIIIIFIAFLAIRWAMKKPKAKDKPLWSIGYALYFLTDIFTQGYDSDEALGRVVATSRNGMPDLSDFSSQHVIVGLKAYANAQGRAIAFGSRSSQAIENAS